MATNNWGTYPSSPNTTTATQPGWAGPGQPAGWGQPNSQFKNPTEFYPYQMNSMPMQQMPMQQMPVQRRGMSAIVYGLLAMFVPIPVLDIIWAWRGIKIARATDDTAGLVLSIIGMIWSISFNLWFFGFVVFGMLILGAGAFF